MAHQVSDMYEQSSSNASSAAVTSTATQTSVSLQQQQQQLQFAQEFWEEQIVTAEQFDSDFKNHPLPLARIKKVMKSDPEVKMISAEAPILFSKACEIFICEITRRAWLHAEESKRRTLQKSDVASAVSRSDQFDFLIDIVPREEPPKTSKRSTARDGAVVSSEAYEDQPRQYSQYYPQGPGGLAGYAHAIEGSSFYQSMSPEQFQQYVQYQQQAAAQSYHTQQQQEPQQHQPSSSRGGSGGHAGHESGSRQN
ncbi:hypothetical protein BGZ65_007940 [Modicella reniformis]|uniref:Core Histone H2A/H2B/H3 domain-containing protein n=1 Tax=Modicella reniformis TaxID=1440133 RepID=A0A9P6J715_9FUNG|nr:hypothetical protein BGZ65_007940 [Modicella reniformis]